MTDFKEISSKCYGSIPALEAGSASSTLALETTDDLEIEEVVRLATIAFNKARTKMLSTSGSVIEAFNGVLIQTYSDGTTVELKPLEQPIKGLYGAIKTRVKLLS